jgi:hypothetical protein
MLPSVDVINIPHSSSTSTKLWSKMNHIQH